MVNDSFSHFSFLSFIIFKPKKLKHKENYTATRRAIRWLKDRHAIPRFISKHAEALRCDLTFVFLTAGASLWFIIICTYKVGKEVNRGEQRAKERKIRW